MTNFTPVVRENYRVPMPPPAPGGRSSTRDAEHYGGSGKGNGGAVSAKDDDTGGVSATMTLPPLATVMLKQDS